MRHFLGAVAFTILMVVVFLTVGIIAWLLQLAQTYAHHNEQHSYMSSFIPQTCCVTNDCCWEIQPSEVEPLPGDRWRIKSTGQVLSRTDFSPDGHYYRCACDLDNSTQHWVRHQGANTRCLFTPLNTM